MEHGFFGPAPAAGLRRIPLPIKSRTGAQSRSLPGGPLLFSYRSSPATIRKISVLGVPLSVRDAFEASIAQKGLFPIPQEEAFYQLYKPISDDVHDATG